MTNAVHTIEASSIEEAISMLERHVASDQLAPLFDVLRALPANPNDGALLDRLAEVVDGLGTLQGAVLTYAPSIAGLLSDHPFGRKG